MSLRIVVDKREPHVLAALKEKVNKHSTIPIQIHEAMLELGDFEIYSSQTLKHIIERKTSSDLLSSIVDGRYKSQSIRLRDHPLANKHIYYVLETRNLAADKRLVSCVASLNQQGFSVFRTLDCKDTAFFLLSLAAKAGKGYCAGPAGPETYVGTIKASK